MTSANKLLLSKELHIISHANGIKLVSPNLLANTLTHAQTVGNILQQPFSFYFLNTDGATQLINEEGADICGFDSVNNAFGKTLFDVSHEKSATKLINNCSEVIHASTTKIYEEENSRKDGATLQFLSVKIPWYNDDNKIIGIMGCSIVLGKHSLPESLAQLSSFGFLDKTKFSNHAAAPLMDLKINNVHLTQREMQCLKLTIKGLTAKKIAQQLGISYRTVEEYLLNIRVKAGVDSKSELIEMTMDCFHGSLE